MGLNIGPWYAAAQSPDGGALEVREPVTMARSCSRVVLAPTLVGLMRLRGPPEVDQVGVRHDFPIGWVDEGDSPQVERLCIGERLVEVRRRVDLRVLRVDRHADCPSVAEHGIGPEADRVPFIEAEGSLSLIHISEPTRPY